MKDTQNQLESGALIYNEYTDPSGFVIRQMLRTKNHGIAFQAGKYVTRPCHIPVYNAVTKRLTHHREGDDIRVFHLHGTGRTKEEAMDRASEKLIKREIAKLKKAEVAKKMPLAVK